MALGNDSMMRINEHEHERFFTIPPSQLRRGSWAFYGLEAPCIFLSEETRDTYLLRKGLNEKF